MKQFFLFAAALCCAIMAQAGDYSNYGALQIRNNQLCDQSGNPVQLRGWSTDDWVYIAEFDDSADFQKMKSTGANIARIAVWPEHYIANEASDMAWLKNCIDYCAAQNMYCIVDWHLWDNPLTNLTQAKTFFSTISNYVKTKNYHHVLYEICNEPNQEAEGTIYELGKAVWTQTKTYAADVLPLIKANDPNAIVIVGTPQWCEGLVFPMIDPLDEQGMNVMYGFHSYTSDQERYLGLLSAASAFIPVFVSAWSVNSLYNNGSFAQGKPIADLLMNICNGQNLGNKLISWCNWSWSDKGVVSSAFTNYAIEQWTQSGNYVKGLLASTTQAARNSTAYEVQEFDGINDGYLHLEKYNNGGAYNAYWDFDDVWTSCYSQATSTRGCNKGTTADDGFRTNQMVDLSYTNIDHKDDSYIALTYTMEGEWVEYTINAAYAGDYEFEVYTNNHIDDNIFAIAVDGANALVDEDGNVVEQALLLPPSKGGSTSGGYDEWGWTTPKSRLDANKKFRIRLKQGEQKLAVAFMAQTAGLGAIKLKGHEPQGIEDVTIDNSSKARKVIVDGILFIEKNGKLYNAQGAEVK